MSKTTYLLTSVCVSPSLTMMWLALSICDLLWFCSRYTCSWSTAPSKENVQQRQNPLNCSENNNSVYSCMRRAYHISIGISIITELEKIKCYSKQNMICICLTQTPHAVIFWTIKTPKAHSFYICNTLITGCIDKLTKILYKTT